MNLLSTLAQFLYTMTTSALNKSQEQISNEIETLKAELKAIRSEKPKPLFIFDKKNLQVRIPATGQKFKLMPQNGLSFLVEKDFPCSIAEIPDQLQYLIEDLTDLAIGNMPTQELKNYRKLLHGLRFFMGETFNQSHK